MALYRHTSGFVGEFASNPGAGYTAITAQPTDTLANRVAWWRNVDKGSQTSSWHPSEYRTPQDPAEAVLSMGFSKDAAFFSADSTGAVTDAYLGGSCTVTVTRGGTDVTDSEGWTLTKVDDGCTSTLAKAGGVWTLTITNVALLVTKSGYVRVTATRTGSTTQVRDWNWMKVQNGSNGTNGTNGTDGTRGSRQILVTTADGVWSDLTAWNGIVTQTGTNPVLSDLVTIAKSDGSVATSKFCTGNSASPGVWTTPNAYINGSLLVTGTVGASQIAAGSITTSKLAVGSGGNLLPNSAPTPGAETADWLVGFKNVTPAVTLAAGTTGEYPIGGASIKATVGGTPTSGQVFTVEGADTIPVVAGQNYEVSGYFTQTGCSQAFIFVDWLTSALTSISSSYGTVTAAAPSNTLANWPRSGVIAAAPATAAAAKVYFRGVVNGAANPKVIATQLYFGKAGPNQTEFSDWSPAGVGTQIDGTGIKAGSITADRLVAGTITADLINSGTIGASTIILNGATSILKSSTYVAGSAGWQLKGDGSFEANSGTFKNVTITGTLTATTVYSGTWTAANIPNLNASKITAGTIDASVIGVTNLNASNINTGTLNCASLTVTNLRANSITVGTLVTEQIGTNAVTAAGGVSGSGTTVASGYAYDFFTFSLPGVTYGRGNIAINWQILVSIDTATALQATVRIYRAVGGGGYVVSRTYEIGYNYTNIGYSGKHLFTGVYFDSTQNSSALDYKIEITNASATTISVIGRDAWYVEMKR